jgi:predicted outer membrane protein
MKIASRVFELTLASLLASLVTAQNDPPTRPDPTKDPSRQDPTRQDPSKQDPRDLTRGMNTESDRILATWVQVGNNNELELAKVAQQRAQSPQVKEFAQMMLKDHGEFGQKLQPYGEAAGMPPGRTTDPSGRTTDPTGKTDPTGRTDPTGKPDPTGRDPSGRTTDPTGRDPSGRPFDASARLGAFNHVGLVKELGQQCLASAKRELESKTGPEFDRCYVGMQIGAHMQMLDTLQVFQRHASERLRPILQQGEQTVQHHLLHAKQLGKQLETGGAADGNGKK